MKLFKKAKKGFTLIELVVVIAVIAILSAVSVVAYVGITNNAKKSVAQQEADKMKTMLTAELTRSDFKYVDDKGTTSDKTDDVTYTLHLNAAEERIEYSATDTVEVLELNKAFEKLVVQAQGYENEEDCLYRFSKLTSVSPATYENESSEKFIIKLVEENSALSLLHTNGISVNFVEVYAAQ